MDFIPGFRWCVPMAFASAVGSCRFELGDVLYRDEKGYAVDRGRGGGAYVQVLDPPRGTRATGAEGEGRRFVANWESPVVLDLVRKHGATTTRVEALQGQLFACLWRDDLSCLDEDAPLPDPPRLARELRSALDGAGEAVLEAIGGERPGRGSLFASVVDLSSDASRVKAHGVETAIAERGSVQHWDLVPADLGLDGAQDYHPALIVRVLFAAGLDEEALTDRLEALLYGGRRKPESGDDDDSASRGRFSLSRHGLVL